MTDQLRDNSQEQEDQVGLVGKAGKRGGAGEAEGQQKQGCSAVGTEGIGCQIEGASDEAPGKKVAGGRESPCQSQEISG